MDTSKLLKLALSVLLLASLLIAICFFSDYWLQSFPSESLPNPKFLNLGLWGACMNGYFDQGHQYEITFHGCKHILLEEYDIIRSELSPPWFVAVQFMYTLSLIGLLITLALTAMFLFCMEDYYRVKVLRWIGLALVTSAVLGTIAIIIFWARANGRDFMPDWKHNYLSWSFALGCVGGVLQYIAAILFLVEARIEVRRDKAQEVARNTVPAPGLVVFQTVELVL